MGPEWIVGALAFITIAMVLAFALRHYSGFLKDRQNRDVAKNVMTGGKGASTQVAEDAPSGSYHDRPLKARLDDSQDSKHPYDPDQTRRGVS